MKRQLEDCKTWFIDATFHFMQDPMKQVLYKLYYLVFHNDSNIDFYLSFCLCFSIKNDKGDFKQVPLLFCCMTRRHVVDYIAVFEKLKLLKITKFRFTMN
ncbi:Uncharacterized protein APZ42_028937 [Daphnia magna]|uniref:Uncharacterized protein n=1 Tax=Daphnia magna TaxID=35525 RepID=A0A164Q2L4_9CRUS|nr:Uncharacterized protein APZ42_028937 [Daphnia magna]